METSGKLRIAAVACALLAGVTAVAPGRIIYVDEDATGANDGSSWVNAYRFLPDALTDAARSQDPVEIRVAQGIYQPDRSAAHPGGTRDRTAGFRLLDAVAVMGGFAGLGAPDPNARDVQVYETILSGDLLGNDSDVNDPRDLQDDPARAENCYHVLTALYTSDTPVVDGFTITGGNANDSQYRRSRGGALWCWFATPAVRNCVIRQNSALDYGGGLSECGKVEDCLITQNSARLGGGLFRCGPVVHCIVMYNYAGVRGGGMSDCESVADCVVGRNCAETAGGGIMGNGSTSRIARCVITANDAYRGGGLADCDVLLNCVVAGNRAEIGAGASDCSRLTNCTVVENRARDLGGGVYEGGHKTTVSNSILWANTAMRGTQVALSGFCVGACGGPGHPAISYCYYGSVSFRYSTVDAGIVGIYADREGCDVEWMEGNLEVDPCFADVGHWNPNNTPEDAYDDFFVEGDYHLRSQAGRWDPNGQTWVKDDATSPCIDAGDPDSPVGEESLPNGGRVNMGAYGGTVEASKSFFLGETE